VKTLQATVAAILGALWCGLGGALAADMPRPAPEPAPIPPAWTIRVTPYGWLTSVYGDQTVRGRTAKVNASFIDIVDATIGEGGTLVGLMGDVEARYGRFSLFGDLVFTKIATDRSGVRTKTSTSEIVGSIGASAGVSYAMTILEAGASYELARIGSAGFDVLMGARYWNQTASLSFDLATTVDTSDLSVGRNRAIAKSGTVDWVDGFVGARVRVAVAPGHDLFVRGDVGGGGSKISWQGLAGYSYDFAEKNGVTYSGVIGYKALYVDYAKGEGRRRYEFDMLQHGPVVGLSIRF
jgi:hypothetical protein